jgi:HEAT repeat protein
MRDRSVRSKEPQVLPVQIPDEAWPKKEPANYHLEKVTDPLEALQIAANKNDQDSIDHYLAQVVAQGDNAVPRLKELLASAKDRDAAKLFAYALSKIGTKAAVTALIEAANTNADKDLRYLIEEFIRGVKTPEGTSALLHGVSAEDEGEAELCSRLLSASPDSDVFHQVLALTTNADEKIRSGALDVLSRLSAPEHGPALQELTMSRDSAVAEAALYALANLSTEDAVQLLLTSFYAHPPLPDTKRFVEIVEETRRMLEENPEKPGLAITVESLMTTSSNVLTRAAAVAVMEDSGSTNRENLVYALNKAFQYEESSLVLQMLEDAIARTPFPNNVTATP